MLEAALEDSSRHEHDRGCPEHTTRKAKAITALECSEHTTRKATRAVA
jgi:hypothetical protein